MAVRGRDLMKHLARHGYRVLREGAKHWIYTNGDRIISIKRHRQFDRVAANEICKQAGLYQKF